MEKVRKEYNPDFVSPPGETLLEALQERGMTISRFSERIRLTRQQLHRIIRGTGPITPATALELERTLKIPARFWNKREQAYQDFLARKREANDLRKSTGWLSEFPLKEMMKWGFIQKTSCKTTQVREILTFFGVSNVKSWSDIQLKESALWRRSFAVEPNPIAIASWLRKGELDAHEQSIAPYDRKSFQQALPVIRSLTGLPLDESAEKLKSLCGRCGVAVVFVPALRGTGVCGAARWLSTHGGALDMPVIQLSLRYRSDDHLWFTFFHEAGHIVLDHPKKNVFIDDKTPQGERWEAAANRWASDFLIPRNAYQEFLAKGSFNKDAVLRFASKQGIAPGVVVGRLQFDGRIPNNSMLNKLKRRYRLESFFERSA